MEGGLTSAGFPAFEISVVNGGYVEAFFVYDIVGGTEDGGHVCSTTFFEG